MMAFDRGRRRRSEEHTSELQSPYDLVCRLLLEKKTQEEKGLEQMGALYLCVQVRIATQDTADLAPSTSLRSFAHLSHIFFVLLLFFFLMKRAPPKSTLFPPPPFSE